MANKTISDLTALTSIDRAADYFEVADASDSNASRKTTVNSMLNVTSQPLALTDTQSPTNKTFDNTNIFTIRDDRLTLQDNADTTKQAVFQLSGITTGTTRTYTLPNASSTLVDLSTTQTLTNKTLTSPTINTATISNPTLTVDTVSEYTGANGVTVDGLNIKDSKLNTNNSVVTANITNASVTADKLSTGASTATVATSETTTSTSFTDLSTSGPAVSLTIGANGIALVIVYAAISNSSGSDASRMGFVVSGASTVAAAAAFSVANVGTNAQRISATFLVTSLTAGSNTFTAKYNVSGGTGTFVDRKITVVPL